MQRGLLVVLVASLLGPPTAHADYGGSIQRVRQVRQRLAERYRKATPRGRRAVLEKASHALAGAVADGLAPPWIGTPWAYHGTTTTPRRGRIACGYFISTLLRDAGLRVERVAMARRASERIIKSLVTERFIRRFSDVPLPRFLARVRAMGDGLFVIGLDNHVGFLVVRGARMRFIHADPDRGVVDEPAARSRWLRASRYRVAGHLADPGLMRRWLLRRPIPTR